MNKRDSIQRCIMVVNEDSQGGVPAERDLKETVPAHVSQTTTFAQMTQYGVKNQIVLNVVTSIKLDEYVKARYIWQGKLFRVMRQVKSGNEYFSVLMESNE